MKEYPKPVALCDAIKNVVEDLQHLDLAIQEAFHFVLEEDAANDPEHDTEEALFEAPQAWRNKPVAAHYLANFRRRCRAELRRRGLSENAFAQRIGIAQKTVWKTLKGDYAYSPRFDTMLKIAQGLDLDLLAITQDTN